MRTPSSNYFYTTYDMYPVDFQELKKENKQDPGEGEEKALKQLLSISSINHCMTRRKLRGCQYNIRPASILLA